MLDNSTKSYQLVSVQEGTITIEICFAGEERHAILGIDFMDERTLQNIELSYYDAGKSEWIVYSRQDTAKSYYEFYINALQTNKIRITGCLEYEDQDDIVIEEIVLSDAVKNLY